MRPLVGVAGEEAVVRKHFGDQPVVAASRAVVAGVRAAGGHPVVVPPGSDPDLLARVDALVLTGGPDVGLLPVRDREEIGLLDAARRLGVPTLGICRGLQLMAVGTGGTLVPELGDAHVLGLEGTHPLRAVPGSLAAELVPAGVVGSLHHQSVATHDPRWVLTATAPDGVVEALEWHDQADWPALGVQWHPELDPTGPALFGWLVEVAHLRGVGRAAAACWHGPMDSDKAEAVQNVVDRVSSYQDGAPEGTVEKELRSGLGEAGVELDDTEVTTLTRAIEQQDSEVDVAAVLG